MGRLEDEALTAMTVLLKGGHTQSAVARLLGVTEGSVRYHRRRRESGATDGRSRQVSAASVGSIWRRCTAGWCGSTDTRPA
jgi:transposase-like protein